MTSRKEIQIILKFFDQAQKEAVNTAILQVIRVEESSYRREGARMLVREDGNYVGGISGGCLEGDALQKSQMAIVQGTPTVVTYDTSKDDERNIGAGLGCNGIIDVLVIPLLSNTKEIMEVLRKSIVGRKTNILATITKVSVSPISESSIYLGKTFLFEDVNKGQSNFSHVLSCLQKTVQEKEFALFLNQQIAMNTIDGQPALDSKLQQSRSVTWEHQNLAVSVYFEYLHPSIHVVIFGDNYDVYPILTMCEILGWEVSLVGNLNKLSPQVVPDSVHLYAKDNHQLIVPQIDSRTAILLMSHDFQTDYDHLLKYSNSRARYIGLLGPKKRFVKLKERLLQEQKINWNSDIENRCFGPSGLDIFANQPEEIAMSILAEICAVFGEKKGIMLREKSTPIHDRPNITSQVANSGNSK